MGQGNFGGNGSVIWRISHGGVGGSAAAHAGGGAGRDPNPPNGAVGMFVISVRVPGAGPNGPYLVVWQGQIDYNDVDQIKVTWPN